MHVTFINKAQVTWAYDSLHLYRTLKYMSFKRSMEFPQFLQLDAATQDARCKKHNILIYRIREWLDELKKTGSVVVRDDEIELMIKILKYRPFHFHSPDEIIGQQLSMLTRHYV